MQGRNTSVAALVVLAALLGGCGGTPAAETSQGPQDAQDAQDVAALLRGIPQAEGQLGEPDAPDFMRIYADPDGLRYGGFARDVLPELIERHVRPGRLRIQLAPVTDGVAPVGDDDPLAPAADVLAADAQGRAWDFALLYERRGTGAYDPGLGAWVADDAVGLDGRRFEGDRRARSAQEAAELWAERFERAPGQLPLLRLDPAGRGTDDVVSIELPATDPGEVLDRIERAFGY